MKLSKIMEKKLYRSMAVTSIINLAKAFDDSA